MNRTQRVFKVGVGVDRISAVASHTSEDGEVWLYARPIGDDKAAYAKQAAVHGLGSAMFGDRHVKQVRHVEGDAWEIVTNTTEVIG